MLVKQCVVTLEVGYCRAARRPGDSGHRGGAGHRRAGGGAASSSATVSPSRWRRRRPHSRAIGYDTVTFPSPSPALERLLGEDSPNRRHRRGVRPGGPAVESPPGAPPPVRGACARTGRDRSAGTIELRHAVRLVDAVISPPPVAAVLARRVVACASRRTCGSNRRGRVVGRGRARREPAAASARAGWMVSVDDRDELARRLEHSMQATATREILARRLRTDAEAATRELESTRADLSTCRARGGHAGARVRRPARRQRRTPGRARRGAVATRLPSPRPAHPGAAALPAAVDVDPRSRAFGDSSLTVDVQPRSGTAKPARAASTCRSCCTIIVTSSANVISGFQPSTSLAARRRRSTDRPPRDGGISRPD